MPGEYLSFGLADDLYAIPIVKVREILGGAPRVTRIPNSPAFLEGLINLRGSVIPFVDMRKELGMAERPHDRFTIVIVAEVAGTVVGLAVDSVVDVVSFGERDVQPPPANLSAQVRAEFIAGLAEVSGRLVILLDLDKVLTDEQVGVLVAVGAS
jgi:purine-binding chemotaxis protein CheW